jgi:hypothetical protein
LRDRDVFKLAGGYASHLLTGVWATATCLHNGSVLTLNLPYYLPTAEQGAIAESWLRGSPAETTETACSSKRRLEARFANMSSARAASPKPR